MLKFARASSAGSAGGQRGVLGIGRSDGDLLAPPRGGGGKKLVDERRVDERLVILGELGQIDVRQGHRFAGNFRLVVV